VPIGRPIANTRVYVLDGEGSPVPVGVAGELYIAGSGLARGYRNQHALTRERFVTRTGVPDDRVYRSGDLARWRSDGVLEFLGRTDAQIKVRGFRIAPEEVEAALTTHPRVAAAAAKSCRDRDGEQTLVAYVVPHGIRPPRPADLRRHLSRFLPSYMVPSRFVALPSLPTTPNGKLDRNRLPDIDGGGPRSYLQPPRSGQERRLAAIWQEMLDIPQVRRTDDFFDLGGHSLLAAKLLRRIEAHFGVRLPMAALLHAPTLAQMATLVSLESRPLDLRAAAQTPCLLWVNGGPAFRHLNKSLEPDQPLVSVSVTPDDFLSLGDAPSFSAIAARLVEAIRSVQPNGPYYIGGWCIDGILAFEAAAQLMSAGAAVGLVVMLHSANPVHFRRLGGTSIQLSKFKYHWEKLRQLHGSARWSYAAARLRGAVEPNAPWLRATRMLHKAALEYEPQSYPGAVLLLQPTDRPRLLDYGPGWADVVSGDLAVFDCPGDHCSMLEPPNVEFLTGRIREQLRLLPAIAPAPAAE